MTEWQPIETAPKDGTYFLLACRDVDGNRGVYMGTTYNGYICWSDDIGWPLDDDDSVTLDGWMPLPEPPK